MSGVRIERRRTGSIGIEEKALSTLEKFVELCDKGSPDEEIDEYDEVNNTIHSSEPSKFLGCPKNAQGVRRSNSGSSNRARLCELFIDKTLVLKTKPPTSQQEEEESSSESNKKESTKETVTTTEKPISDTTTSSENSKNINNGKTKESPKSDNDKVKLTSSLPPVLKKSEEIWVRRAIGGRRTFRVTPKRSVWSIEDDILLLKHCVQQNPFQLGSAKWEEIKAQMDLSEGKQGISVRGLKDRLKLLREKYDSEQLTCKSGEEEIQSERGNLLEELKSLISQADSPINDMIGSENDIDGLVFDEIEVIEALNLSKGAISQAAKKVTDRMAADLEREELVKSIDTAPSPNETRKKRLKLSPEDELIRIKQETDAALENRKVDLEEKKIALEHEKLKIELQKEERLMEESRRRDELASSQLKLQSDMYELMKSMVSKTNQ